MTTHFSNAPTTENLPAPTKPAEQSRPAAPTGQAAEAKATGAAARWQGRHRSGRFSHVTRPDVHRSVAPAGVKSTKPGKNLGSRRKRPLPEAAPPVDHAEASRKWQLYVEGKKVTPPVYRACITIAFVHHHCLIGGERVYPEHDQ